MRNKPRGQTLVEAVVVIGMVVLLVSGVCAGEQRQYKIGEIPSVLPQQKSITVFRSDGGITIGSYNRETGSLFLLDPSGKMTIGRDDGGGNITILESGGEDDD